MDALVEHDGAGFRLHGGRTDECDKVRDMIRNTKVSGFGCRAIQSLDLTDPDFCYHRADK